MHPNKIYVAERAIESWAGKSFFVVVVIAASDIDVAKQHIKDKFNIDIELMWLMNATYPTIYVQDGSAPMPIQAKILYNTALHYKD